jgi:hypothetical protein
MVGDIDNPSVKKRFVGTVSMLVIDIADSLLVEQSFLEAAR